MLFMRLRCVWTVAGGESKGLRDEHSSHRIMSCMRKELQRAMISKQRYKDETK